MFKVYFGLLILAALCVALETPLPYMSHVGVVQDVEGVKGADHARHHVIDAQQGACMQRRAIIPIRVRSFAEHTSRTMRII